MINVVQKGMEYEIRFPYNQEIIDIVKSVPGRRWVPESKCWTLPLARLGFLIASFKGTKYENELVIQSAERIDIDESLDPSKSIPNVDISDADLYVEEGSTLFKHQIDSIKYDKYRWENGLRSGFILADQPGCISGQAEIQIKEPGKPATRSTSLKNAFKLWNSGYKFKIKTLSDGRFIYSDIKSIVCTGIKNCIHISYGDYSIDCTPDHKIYTPNGWVEARSLKPGDEVMCNGLPVCKLCGSTENVITNKYSKYIGYCKHCMYSKLRNCYPNYWKSNIVKKIDEFGYVRLFGPGTYSMPSFKTVNGMGIYEHHQVWYENTGHVVDTSKEIVHHKNHIKTDNRFSNLELMSISDHGRLHSDVGIMHLPQYNPSISEIKFKNRKSVWYVPHPVTVTEVKPSGQQEVYDVSINSDSVHNFVANRLVVHNCGKTLTVLNIAMYHKKKYGCKHCLIIACVNSAKYNWRDDIIKHSNGAIEPYILGSRLRRDGSIRYEGSGKEKFDDLKTMKMYGDENGQDLPYFLIINIEAIGRTKLGKTHIITEQVINLVNSKEVGVIALDEIHRNASMTSEQGKQLMQIKKKIDSGIDVDWIPMTGTPIKSRPTDAFLPLRLVGAHDYTSYYNWCEYFCIKGNFKEIIGYKNIDKLKNMLQPNMLRRLKKDILDLPEKMHNTVYVENTLYQHKLYEKVRDGLFSQIGSIKKSANPLAQLIKLRQVNGSPELVDIETQFTESTYLKSNAKLAELLRLVEEITEDGSKVVVFSNWVEPLRTLYKYMSKQYKVCCYTGTMSNEDRELHKKTFINNPEYKIMLGTVGALGTSHTLTVAHNVIFYDEPWNPCDIEQCEDRCHRPGTNQTVNIYTLITQGTIDETVHKILHKKEGVATFMVDNELDVKKHPELLNMFLQSSK